MAKTEAHVISTVHALLGNLMGPQNRLFEMGEWSIQPQDLPDDLTFEKQVLELIYKYPECPERATILNHLLLNAPETAQEAISKRFEAIQGTSDRAIPPLAFPLKHWGERRHMEQAIEYGARKLSENRADNALVYKEIVDRMVDARPASADRAQRVTNLERIDQWAKNQRARRDGKSFAAGPRWPFKALNVLLPVMRASDLCGIYAQTKTGKSTLLSVFAEFWAWQEGFDVLKLNFETDHESFQERQFARHLLIPIRFQRNARIWDIDNDKPDFFLPDRSPISPKALFQQFRSHVEKNGQERGEVIEIHCPTWTIAEMRNAIDLQRRLSMQRGRRLIVIIDHLQAIPRRDEYGKTNEVLEDYYNQIKQIPESYSNSEWPVYTFLIDQERNAEDEKVPTDPAKIMERLKSIRSRGTSGGSIRSQIQLSLQRPLAENDSPVQTADKDGVMHMAVDALGNERYYSREGQAAGDCWLFVVRANDGSPGWVNMRIENELYRMDEAPEQTCPFVQSKLNEQDALLHRMGIT